MRNFRQKNSARRGMALIVTLAVLLMVTIIVVAYAAIVRTETVTARSRFESERAAQFSRMAVDEAMVKLRDHIPLDSHWAAGPGRMCAYQNGGWVFTDLFSGKATGSATGSVALNAPLAGAGGGYPILAPNTEFPNPDPMKVAWINVLRDGTRSTDTDYATRLTPQNPLVGRYAYWVDTETSKVNLNTAGRAKTSYNLTSAGVGDIQNLSGHPSRVDLSKLDEAGGAISPALSLATYDYTASSFWNETPMTVPQYTTPLPPRRLAGEGMKRFNSIQDWSQIFGITPDMIQANQFNLTTLARSPELNPWGLNKWWWQNNAPQRPVSQNRPGNRLNAPGSPVYSDALMSSPPNFSTGAADADTRYYVYPAFLGLNSTDPNINTHSKSTQWLGGSAGFASSPTNFQNYMASMMALLNRNDWPGMPVKSFVDKYGRDECESLAGNILYFFDSTVGGAGLAPWRLAKGNPFGVYGEGFYNYRRSDNSTHLLSGVGPWAYLNEVGMKFNATRGGYTPNLSPANPATQEFPNSTGTKSQRRPGFAKPVDVTNYGAGYLNYMNVAMIPQVELLYPASLGKGVYGTNVLAIFDVEVTATGTFNGGPVTYSGSDYIWGKPDVVNSTDQFRTGYGFTPTFDPSDTPAWWNWNGRTIFVGPFDYGTMPQVTIKLRVGFSKMNKSTNMPPTQVAPLPLNDTPDAVNETPDDIANPRKLSFTLENFALTTVNMVLSKWASVELTDPRVYRHVSDWRLSTHPSGHSLGARNTGFEEFVVDPLTGVTGDYSKLAWPDVTLTALSDYRRSQTASQVANLPGLGWLSVLPVNSESSKTSADGKPVPWRALNFGPAIRPDQLPDWLLLDAFAMAYDSSYLSQTQGKVNLNTEVYPFGFHRTTPLKALLIPSTVNTTTSAAAIVAELSAYTGINGGPCAGLPSDLYVYPGQICQLPSLQGSGTNQFQREALIRDVAGLLTTQSSDFTVHVAAQALNPQGKPVAEQRMSALISRTVDVGPDEVPATADDPVKWKYDTTDPVPEGGAGRPPFRFHVSRIQFQNQ